MKVLFAVDPWCAGNVWLDRKRDVFREGKKTRSFSRLEQKKNLFTSPGETKGDSAIRFVQGKSDHFSSLFLHLELMHVDSSVFMDSIVGMK